MISTSKTISAGRSIKSRLIAALTYIAFFFLFLIVGFVTNQPFILVLSLLLFYSAPFVFLFLWINNFGWVNKITTQFEQFHLKIFWIAALFTFLTYSNKWAGDLINDIFKVDPSHFGISSKVFTALFLPMLILHSEKKEYISAILTLIMYYGSPFALIIALCISLKKNNWRIFVGIIIILTVTAFWIGITISTQKHSLDIIKSFAIWADFNNSYLCKDKWLKNSEGVIFLSNGKVLAFFPSNDESMQLITGDCTFNDY